MSTTQGLEQESRYDILQNREGDILIIINSRQGGPENPRFIYDGGATALLYRTKEMAVVFNNIADATWRANFEVLSRNFDLIFINIGINDLRRRKDSNLQLDFSEGVRVMYWNRLLDIATKTNATIVVTDLLPVVEERYTEQASLIRCNSDVEKYNEIIENICKQRNILFFSRYDKWIKRDLQNLYKDATHPNATGHQIIAEEIYEYIKNKNFI